MDYERKDFLVYDLETATIERKTTEIQQYISDFSEYLTLLYKKKNLTSLQKTVNALKNKVVDFVRNEVDNDNIGFAIGRYAGIVEVFENIVVDAIRKENVIIRINESSLEEIPHIYDVILHVANNPGIRHGKLAEKVGIEKNTLTSIMDKLVDVDLITFSRPGKFKYYYLTQSGENYYNSNLEKFNSNYSLDFLIEQMLLILSHSDKPSETVADIMKALYEGEYKFDGYKSKKSDAIDPWDLLPEMILKYPIHVSLETMSNSIFADTATLFTLPKEISEEKYLLFSSSCLTTNNVLLHEEI